MDPRDRSEGEATKRTVLVPGLRLPGTKGADLRVFRPLLRAHGGSDGDHHAHIYGYRTRRHAAVVRPWQADRPGDHGLVDTIGPVARLSEEFAASLRRFIDGGGPGDAGVSVVGYSVGGVIALHGIARLADEHRARIDRLVLLAAPVHGFDEPALKSVFGPPFLSRGVDVVDRVARRMYPGFGNISFDCEAVGLPPTLCVAVDGDVVAPPSAALLGWPDRPPMNVDWFRIEPRSETPPRYTRFRDLGTAMQAVSRRHAEVVVRRDAVRTIAKFVRAEGA